MEKKYLASRDVDENKCSYESDEERINHGFGLLPGLTHVPVSLKHVKETFFEEVLLDQSSFREIPKPGSLGKVEVAVLRARGSGHRLDDPGLGKVIEALLHLDVGGAEIELHARRRANRADGGAAQLSCCAHRPWPQSSSYPEFPPRG